MDRRHFLGASGAMMLAACAGKPGQGGAGSDRIARMAAAEATLAALEASTGGRLGAYVLDTGSGEGFGIRAGERFAHCSTFKLSLAALVLREADAGRLDPAEVLTYSRADLLPNSPDTGANADKGGMTVLALAEAQQLTSDNLAANLLLRRLGGPAAMTAFWRAMGDDVSRLDRYETALNNVPPGEVRDTTTPEAIARSVARFVVGDVLTPSSRATLQGWMERTATGTRRIRAALPAGWRAGDKTGTAINGSFANKVNDIAVLYPPAGAAPLVVVGFFEADGYYDTIRPQDEAVLKQLGEIAVQWAN